MFREDRSALIVLFVQNHSKSGIRTNSPRLEKDALGLLNARSAEFGADVAEHQILILFVRKSCILQIAMYRNSKTAHREIVTW